MGVLKGSVFFITDLSRRLTMPAEMAFMDVSSYYDSTHSSGEIKINLDLDLIIKDKHVLIVEDIIDTRRTLHILMERLKVRKPASISLAALLNKPVAREFEITSDYVGFEIPDKLVFGYGLDYAQRYRNLPYIGVLNFSEDRFKAFMTACDKEKLPNSFIPLSSDEILKALDMGREQNKAGKGISFEKAIKHIGLKIEF